MRCKAWWKKATEQTGEWSLVLSEEGKEIKGQPSSRSHGGQGDQRAGDGSDNLLLALHFAAGHSEAINVSHIL